MTEFFAKNWNFLQQPQHFKNSYFSKSRPKIEIFQRKMSFFKKVSKVFNSLTIFIQIFWKLNPNFSPSPDSQIYFVPITNGPQTFGGSLNQKVLLKLLQRFMQFWLICYKHNCLDEFRKNSNKISIFHGFSLAFFWGGGGILKNHWLHLW